jgi:WD40 repeat protein
MTIGVEFFPDGERVATTSFDGNLHVWRVASGARVAAVPAGAGTPFGMDLSPDGTTAAVGGDAGVITLWDLSGAVPQQVLRLAGHSGRIHDVAFDDAGSRLASSGVDGVRIWDLSPAAVAEAPVIPGPGPFALSPDGATIAATTEDGLGVALLDAATLELRTEVEDVALPPADLGSVSLGATGLLATTTFAFFEEPGSLTLWDAATGAMVSTLLDHPFMRGGPVFSPDGRLVASGLCDFMPSSVASVWEVASGARQVLPITAGCGVFVAFGPQDRLLAVRTHEDESNVRVLDVETSEVVFEATHGAQWFGGLAFSPDGERLLSAGADGAGRVWDLASGEEVLTLEGHSGSVEAAAFGPDGTIATGGSDGTLRLWDAATGEQQMVLRCRDGMVADIVFDPTRDRVHAWCAGQPENESIASFTLDVAGLVAVAEGRLTRPFSESECATYRLDSCAPEGE